jgi:hypothetical protein
MANPGPSWHVVGTGDFNSDGHSDILWQNDNGTPAIWLMNGLNFIGGGGLPNPGPSWQVAGRLCRGIGRNWCSGISGGPRLSRQAARSMH